MDDKKTNQVKIVNIHGSTMMSVDKVVLKEGNISMIGNIMGTMPGTFYLSPENLWKMVRLMNASIIFALPGLLLKGFLANRQRRG